MTPCLRERLSAFIRYDMPFILVIGKCALVFFSMDVRLPCYEVALEAVVACRVLNNARNRLRPKMLLENSAVPCKELQRGRKRRSSALSSSGRRSNV